MMESRKEFSQQSSPNLAICFTEQSRRIHALKVQGKMNIKTQINHKGLRKQLSGYF